jgi:hypothetical protein
MADQLSLMTRVPMSRTSDIAVRTRAAVSFVALVVLTVVCSGSADRRIRTAFGIARDRPLSDATIRAAALSKLPIGTHEKDIYPSLEQLGVGKHGLSRVYPADVRRQTVIRFEFDPVSLNVVHRHYGIIWCDLTPP